MTLSRQAFIESHGAVCRNWRWSWGFVNHQKRHVIFGAWDIHESSKMQVILKDDWEYLKGRRQPGFSEAKEYISLVQNDGYSLSTFKMGHSLVDATGERETAKIKNFVPQLVDCRLIQQKSTFFAVPLEGSEIYGDELDDASQSDASSAILEGGRRRILVSAIERNSEARIACLRVHGFSCAICDFNFAEKYGEIGEGFIHVHHLNPMSKAIERRKVDPVKDLVPVCPNCHAMIHRRKNPYSVQEMKKIIEKNGGEKT